MRLFCLLASLLAVGEAAAFLHIPKPRHHQRSTLIRSRGSPTDNHKDASFRGFQLLEWANKAVPQSALVKTARFGWNQMWKVLMAELAPQSADGGYVRPSYGFKSIPSSINPEFPLEAGRYHIYLGNACPWCHRVSIAHALRGLSQDQVSYSYAIDDPEKASRGGWAFVAEQGYKDPVFGCNDLREVYELCSPGYRGRCTAPVMIDKKKRRIVNNESSQLVRMLNDFEPPQGKPAVDLYPLKLRVEIDRINAMTYPKINNGVYRSGFATTQSAYEAAVTDVFSGLDEVEALLSQRRFLAGSALTEADVRLLPTIIRFDAVYNSIFRCTRRRIADYPHLTGWLREMYQLPGIRQTIDLPGLIRSYYVQLFPLNPSGIYPVGPTEADLKVLEPHDRSSRFPLPAGRGDNVFLLQETSSSSSNRSAVPAS